MNILDTVLVVDQLSGKLLSFTPNRKVTDEVVSLRYEVSIKININSIYIKVCKAYPSAQCAAVTIHWEFIKLPPQIKDPLESISTCQPQSPAVA